MENVEFYSFQSDEYAKELEELSDDINIYDLGKEFKNFEEDRKSTRLNSSHAT